jgi:hypothetical protein
MKRSEQCQMTNFCGRPGCPILRRDSSEVEIAYSTCDGSKVVIVPDTELPKMEESALEDVRCHEYEDLVAQMRPIKQFTATPPMRSSPCSIVGIAQPNAITASARRRSLLR